MPVTINGTTGITTPDLDSGADALINGVTIGQGAFQDQSNTALGNSALSDATAGTDNTAVGFLALQFNSGFNNTGIGGGALQINEGNANTAVGKNALIANTTGYNNTASGVSALTANTTGNNNIASGGSALTANTTGNNNIALGALAGAANTTGARNIFIGVSASGSSVSVNNEVNIYNGSVTARFQGAAGAWSFVSDERDKKNIQDLTIGLDFINQLKARKFAWDMRNSDVDKGKEASGFIAQEVLQVVNNNNAGYTGLVDASNSEQYTFAMSNLIPILVKAVQELSAKVAELEAK